MIFFCLLFFLLNSIIYTEGNLQFDCSNDNILTLKRYNDKSLHFGCQEAKFCEGNKYNCIYNDGRYSCTDPNTFASSIYQRSSDDLILHKCCSFWHRTKEMQTKLSYSRKKMKCFNYEFDFNKTTGLISVYNNNFYQNNLDPLNIKKLYTSINDFNDKEEAIFVKKIQTKRNGYYMTLCNNNCISLTMIDKVIHQTILNDSSFIKKDYTLIDSTHRNIKLQKFKDSKLQEKNVKSHIEKIKKYQWDTISRNIKAAKFKNMLDNFEGKLKQLESNNIQRPASSILINSTQIVMPPLSHSGKYNISGRLLLLFEIERKKKLLMEKLIEKKESSKLQITTPLENTNLVFQTRQEGLKIRIIPENSTGIVQTKLSDVQETTTKNDDETLTIQNIPLSLLLKLVQSNQIKAENEKTTTTTTTVKPKSEDLNSEVLNLQKQLLLALLKEKTESNKDSSLSSISNETLLKLFSNTEQKTTTTTTPEPTTRQHVVLELPKEVLQLFVNSNKESNIEEKDKKSKELSKDDERISLSVVTLLKLLTANRKDENKFKSEEIVPSKNITITSSYKNSHLTTKTLKTTTIKSKDKTYEDNSDEDLIVKSTTKKSNFDNISESKESSEYGIVSSEELTEKPKTTVTTRIKLKKFQTRITKIMSSEENSNNSNESIEVKKKTRITKRHSKASAVTLPLSSNSEELIDTTTMKTSHSRRRRKKNRNSQKHTTLPGTKKNNRRRGKKRKGILDGFNGSQFIMNLIPKLKESFGIEPQIHPLERKINSTTIKSDELLDK